MKISGTAWRSSSHSSPISSLSEAEVQAAPALLEHGQDPDQHQDQHQQHDRDRQP